MVALFDLMCWAKVRQLVYRVRASGLQQSKAAEIGSDPESVRNASLYKSGRKGHAEEGGHF